MPPLKLKKYLFDIRQACEKLTLFTSGKTIDDYKSDDLLRSAVERQFEIVGEALGQMGKAYPDSVTDISDYKRIIAFRNRLIHAYADIDDGVVWGIIEESLPKLIDEVHSILGTG